MKRPRKTLKGPLKIIPNELKQKFTMNNTIPIYKVYRDESLSGDKKIVWTTDVIELMKKHYTKKNILKNKHQLLSVWKHGGEPYPDHRIGGACLLLCKAFNKYLKDDIKNKKVAVIGSTKPWIESILLNYGAEVTTVEYNVPVCKHPKIKCISYYDDFKKNSKKYDIIVTYSSIEHSGLGRYGDYIDHDGDIKAMKDIYDNLKDDGLLFWGGPVGPDALVWNCNRVYGNIRLPRLFKDFKTLEWFGCTLEKALKLPKGNDWKSNYQPVIVLEKL